MYGRQPNCKVSSSNEHLRWLGQPTLLSGLQAWSSSWQSVQPDTSWSHCSSGSSTPLPHDASPVDDSAVSSGSIDVLEVSGSVEVEVDGGVDVVVLDAPELVSESEIEVSPGSPEVSLATGSGSVKHATRLEKIATQTNEHARRILRV
jgi:hypothetical protein